LIATAALEFKGRKFARDLQFFAFVDDICGDGHGIVVFAEVRGRNIVGLEEIFDEAKFRIEYFLKLLNCSVGLV
jgi:hypothetical protein